MDANEHECNAPFLLPLGGEGGRRPDEGAATLPPNTSSIGFTPAL